MKVTRANMQSEIYPRSPTVSSGNMRHDHGLGVDIGTIPGKVPGERWDCDIGMLAVLILRTSPLRLRR
jgi:hypothetical protein